MTELASHLGVFLREHLPRDRNASRHTVQSYADSFQLLVCFAAERLGVRRAPHPPLFGPPPDPITTPARAGPPQARSPSGHSRGVLVRCLGKGDCDGCGDRIPRTYSRRARAADRRPPHRSPRRGGRCCLRGCQSLPLLQRILQRSPTDERERTRTGTAPAGPGVGTQAPARTSRPTQPGRDCRSGRGRQRCRVLGAVRARKSHGNDLRHDAGCASGLRAAPRPASARCRAEPAAGALLVRDAPRDHRDRLAGTTAYALEATGVLDIIHVAAAMRRAVLVAGSSKGLSACRPRLAVLKAPRAAGALMRTETFHEAREYQRNPPSGR